MLNPKWEDGWIYHIFGLTFLQPNDVRVVFGDKFVADMSNDIPTEFAVYLVETYLH